MTPLFALLFLPLPLSSFTIAIMLLKLVRLIMAVDRFCSVMGTLPLKQISFVHLVETRLILLSHHATKDDRRRYSLFTNSIIC